MTSTIVLAGFITLAAATLWFLYSFFLGKPWSIRGLFARTFIKFALRGPELLTYLGILERLGFHGHNARLDDASEAFADKTYAFMKRDLRILKSYRLERLPPGTRLSAEVMEWFLADQEREEAWRYHGYPVNQMFGVQSSLPDFMLTMHPLDNAADIRNYPKRLRRFGVKIGQVLEGLSIRAEKGIYPPRFMIERVLTEMRSFVAHEPEGHPLYVNFAKKAGESGKTRPGQFARLSASVVEALESVVYPAYALLIGHFESLLDKTSSDHGAWALPQGDAYYRWRLHSNTTADYGPEEIHAMGLAEVERIEGEMSRILSETGEAAGASPAKTLAALGKDERFLYPDNEEGRSACLADYERHLELVSAKLNDYFITTPKARLEVARIPAFKEATAPGAYYQPADLGGRRPGIFYANLRDMREVRKFGMKTLAYHEGIPGHHFQIAIAQERKGLPFFRRNLPFTAYAEGWAMYSEQLAREMGMYNDDPYGLLGSYDSELFRAVRLVADTGIHCKRWTRSEAIEYMLAHSAQAEESVVSEVERYFVMPGQACAYKIGMIKMLELRERARSALGERFDIRRWHEAVLGCGSVPLGILEKAMEQYIRVEGGA